MTIDWLVVHLHAVSRIDLMLLVIDGLICSAIVVLVALPASIPGESVTWKVRLARFGIALVYAVIAVRIWTGRYETPVEPTELIANLVVLIQASMVRGDVSVWFEIYAKLSERRRMARLTAAEKRRGWFRR